MLYDILMVAIYFVHSEFAVKIENLISKNGNF